jgi:hypothetical protein
MKKILLITLIVLSSNYANSQNTKKKSNTKSSSVKYSEERALELLADYYEFYNSDEEYENPVVRRISNNVFYIKVNFCNGGKSICYQTNSEGEETKHEFFWSSKVLILKIQSPTKYTVNQKFN